MDFSQLTQAGSKQEFAISSFVILLNAAGLHPDISAQYDELLGDLSKGVRFIMLFLSLVYLYWQTRRLRNRTLHEEAKAVEGRDKLDTDFD